MEGQSFVIELHGRVELKIGEVSIAVDDGGGGYNCILFLYSLSL